MERSADPRRRRGRWFDSFDVLSDVSFQVEAGRTLGIIGANGSGKTTLMKILAGVMQPDSGEIAADGQIGALLELGAGFHAELTGEENIHLNAALLGLGREETRRLLPEIIAFAELERFMDTPIKHYSSGMVVRLGFAIATQIRPRILILDETFAVGDARFQTRALAKIRQMKAEGVTQLIVSHNAELILELSDKVIWLDRGAIERAGDPAEILAAYQRSGAGRLLGTARAESRLMGMGGGEPSVDAAVVRITQARVVGDDARDVIELESADDLELDLKLEADKGTALEEYQVRVWFRRDDGRVVAQASCPIPKPDGADPERAGPGLRVTFDRIALAQGEYEIMVGSIPRAAWADQPRLEADDREQRTFGNVTVATRLKITTPLPYDFRLVVDCPAQWQNESVRSDAG